MLFKKFFYFTDNLVILIHKRLLNLLGDAIQKRPNGLKEHNLMYEMSH